MKGVIVKVGDQVWKDVDPTALSEVERLQVVTKGIFYGPDGELLTGAAEARTRRWFENSDAIREAGDLFGSESDALDFVPGLWRWGTFPSLYGPPKSGKTRFLLNLLADIAVPGRKVLGYFPPAQFPDETDPAQTYIVVVNSENSGVDYEDAFYRLVEDEAVVRNVEFLHLNERGGAGVMDLTVPANLSEWQITLDMKCSTCDGSDWRPIDLLFVDDVTATLKANRKDERDYSEWIGQFNELVRATDVKNGLTVLHAVFSNDHPGGGFASMTGQSGLMAYRRANKKRHEFSVPFPRFPMKEIEPIPVVAEDDLRLRLIAKPARTSAGQRPQAVTAATGAPSIESRIVAWIKSESAAERLSRFPDIARAVGGDVNKTSIALRSLVQDGALTVREFKEPGRPGRAAKVYAVAEPGTGQDVGRDTKASK